MRRFLVRIILFFLFVVIFMVGLEIFVRKIPNSYINKIDIIEQNKHDVELLIMGSSHTHSGINPSVFPQKAINLALGGQGITIDDFVLERYVKDMPKLKYVILPIDYQTLFMPDAYGSPNRYMYYNVYYKFEPKLFSCESYEIFHPLSVRKKIESVLCGNISNSDDSLGFECCKSIGISMAEETVKWQTVENFLSDTVRKNIQALYHIAYMLKEEKVKLILLRMPVHKSFLDLSSRKQNLFSEMIIENLMKKDENIMYFNYYSISLADSCYSDATHLNTRGAKLFTEILVHDMKKVGLLDNH